MTWMTSVRQFIAYVPFVFNFEKTLKRYNCFLCIRTCSKYVKNDPTIVIVSNSSGRLYNCFSPFRSCGTRDQTVPEFAIYSFIFDWTISLFSHIWIDGLFILLYLFGVVRWNSLMPSVPPYVICWTLFIWKVSLFSHVWLDGLSITLYWFGGSLYSLWFDLIG